MTTNKKTPSALLSLLPIIVLVLMLVATVRTYGSDSLSGCKPSYTAGRISYLRADWYLFFAHSMEGF